MTDYNLITVSDIGLYAPEIDTSRFDAPTLSGMITQASRAVSDYLEYSPIAENIVDETKQAFITTEGDLLIFPQKLPIQSVSSISLFKGATTIPLTLRDGNNVDKFNIDYQRRHIRYPYGEVTVNGAGGLITNFLSLRSQSFYVKMSYRGGWETSELPAVIKQACLLFLREMLYLQFNATGAQMIKQGQLTLDYRNNYNTGMSDSKYVRDAKKLLNPYRRIG
jgi:hypothetical protein